MLGFAVRAVVEPAGGSDGGLFRLHGFLRCDFECLRGWSADRMALIE